MPYQVGAAGAGGEVRPNQDSGGDRRGPNEVRPKRGGGAGDGTMENDAKKRKVPSVLDYPPGEYNENVLKANNPMLRVFEQSSDAKKILKGDKIGDGKSMDRIALQRAISKIIDTAAKASVSFKEPSTETGGRIVHGSLILDLWTLTKPSAPPLEVDVEELASDNVGGASDSNDVSDLVIQTTNEDRSSNESSNIRHEGDDPEDIDKDEKTRYDFKLMVRDPKVSVGLDNLVTVMVIKCTWDSMTKTKLYQAGSYACKAALENMKRGRHEPIFIQGWGESMWMYGVLFPSAVVVVENGKVSSVQSNKNLELSSLNKTLKKSTSSMRINFKTNCPLVYPDGEYVAGTLFMSRKKFHLPNLKMKGSGALEDSKLFFQALLRVVIGDKVLMWKAEDIDEAEQERNKMIQKVKNDFLGPEDRIVF